MSYLINWDIVCNQTSKGGWELEDIRKEQTVVWKMVVEIALWRRGIMGTGNFAVKDAPYQNQGI